MRGLERMGWLVFDGMRAKFEVYKSTQTTDDEGGTKKGGKCNCSKGKWLGLL